jgi:hypothetical protein
MRRLGDWVGQSIALDLLRPEPEERVVAEDRLDVLDKPEILQYHKAKRAIYVSLSEKPEDTMEPHFLYGTHVRIFDLSDFPPPDHSRDPILLPPLDRGRVARCAIDVVDGKDAYHHPYGYAGG